MKKYEEFLNDSNPRIKIIMNDGNTMVLELFPACAPVTVENMLELIEDKFYDGLIFHRVIENFMIQGGDPTGTGMGGSKEKIVGEFILNHVKNELMHTKGVISMARTNDYNSASSQFFICHTDVPHLDCQYASFGALIEGFDTLDAIATQKTDNSDRPLTPQIIKTIERIR